MNRSLIIFAREPIPGQVKTRLAASIGDHAAAELYESMVRDVLTVVRRLENVKTVVYWACDEDALPHLSEKFRCISRCQCPGDLGERMQGACADMLAEGYETCCIIGSDAPDLPLAYIDDACRLLEEAADVVFGPSRDGGYYLLGVRRVVPQLFSNISWSSPVVLAQSMAAAHVSGLTVSLLPEWQDIDTVEDLQAYQERVRVRANEESV